MWDSLSALVLGKVALPGRLDFPLGIKMEDLLALGFFFLTKRAINSQIMYMTHIDITTCNITLKENLDSLSNDTNNNKYDD